MALMKFREPNQAQWAGVRPAHQGTEVNKSNTANNAAVVIHTVTAGKTFFLDSYTFNSVTGVSGGESQLFVTDGSDILQYIIVGSFGTADDNIVLHGVFGEPREIPSGWKIWILSPNINFYVRGSVFGREE